MLIRKTVFSQLKKVFVCLQTSKPSARSQLDYGLWKVKERRNTAVGNGSSFQLGSSSKFEDMIYPPLPSKVRTRQQFLRADSSNNLGLSHSSSLNKRYGQSYFV